MDDGADYTRADLEVTRTQTMDTGEFYSLLPPRDDIHYVRTVSDVPSVSIHLLANDTACVWRHRFEPATRRGAGIPFGLQQRAVPASGVYGLRFLQASLLFPHYREGDYPTRAIPVRFQAAAVLKKPGKRATEEQRKAYQQLKQVKNLSTQTLALQHDLRANLDERGGGGRWLLMVGDGSFCNRTIFRRSG